MLFRLRAQTGQTAAEYLGVLVVIAALVGTLVTSTPGKALASGVKREICKIAMDGTCGVPGDVPSSSPRDVGPNGPTLPKAPNSGPRLGSGVPPVEGLPWDGSFSLGSSKSTGGSGKATAGVYVEGSVTDAETSCRIDGAGRPVRQLSVKGTYKAGVKAGAAKGPVAAEIQRYEGKSVGWTILTDPKTAEAIHDGQVPTPADPGSIPTGTTITLAKDFFTGHGGSLRLDGVEVSESSEKGRSLSSSVTRVDDDVVRVTVGDSDYVSDEAALGNPGSVKVTLGSTKRRSSGLIRTLDFNLEDPAAVKAYRAFLASGQLPQPNGSSIGNRRDSHVYDDSETGGPGVRGKLKVPGVFEQRVDIGFETANRNHRQLQTREPDGSTLITDYNQNGRVSVYSQRRSTNGKLSPIDYTLRLQGVDRSSVNTHLSGRPGRKLVDGTRDVELRFTDAQLDELRRQAFEHIRDLHEREGLDYSDAKLRRLLRERSENPYVRNELLPFDRLNGLDYDIATARDPQTALAAILSHAGGNADDLLVTLRDFFNETVDARGEDGGLRANPDIDPFPRSRVTKPNCD